MAQRKLLSATKFIFSPARPCRGFMALASQRSRFPPHAADSYPPDDEGPSIAGGNKISLSGPETCGVLVVYPHRTAAATRPSSLLNAAGTRRSPSARNIDTANQVSVRPLSQRDPAKALE